MKGRIAQIEALEAQLAALKAAEETGIYEDPKTGRWFIVMRLPSGEQTTRRRALDRHASVHAG